MIAIITDSDLSKMIEKKVDTAGNVIILGKEIVKGQLEVNFRIR